MNFKRGNSKGWRARRRYGRCPSLGCEWCARSRTHSTRRATVDPVATLTLPDAYLPANDWMDHFDDESRSQTFANESRLLRRLGYRPLPPLTFRMGEAA